GANGVDESALRRGQLALDPSRARSLASGELGREHDARLVTNAEVDASTTTVDVTLRGDVSVGFFALFGVHDAIPVEVHATAAPRRIP
ncbi:MAG TPA: hypothetical protein VGI86_08950, partial [Acidimicrobiia bacterium]